MCLHTTEHFCLTYNQFCLQLIADERSECAELNRSAILTDAGEDASSSSSFLSLRSLISKAHIGPMRLHMVLVNATSLQFCQIAFYTGYMPLFNALVWSEPLTRNYEIWRQETTDITLSYCGLNIFLS